MVKSEKQLIEEQRKNQRKTEQLNKEIIDNHIELELRRIKASKCVNCGKNLGLTKEDAIKLMKKGRINKRTVCPHCEYMNSVKIFYKGNPQTTKAELAVHGMGFAFQRLPIHSLSKKQRLEWLRNEVNKINDRKSELPPNDRILVLLLGDMMLE